MITVYVQSVFEECIGDIVAKQPVLSMRNIHHHPRTNCLEHSLLVSYISFRVSLKFHLDYRTAARAGLLHDLYLYNPKDTSNYKGLLAFDHPKTALKNAEQLVQLDDKERNIIISHMWPIATHMPHSREAWVVSTVDKVCAVIETLGYIRKARNAWITRYIHKIIYSTTDNGLIVPVA